MQRFAGQQQQGQSSPVEHGEQVPVVVRRLWQRPTLQRLHVSLDTANDGGSGADGGLATSVDGLD